MPSRLQAWLLAATASLVAGCARPQQSQVLAAWTPAPQVPAAQGLPAPAEADALPTPVCTNDAAFVEDLTIPDGTVVGPSEPIDKRWSVRNTGSCNWNAAYRLVPLGETRFVGQEEVALFPARSGEVATLQVVLVAPESPGEYVSRWQAQAPDGSLFGDPIFIFIYVEPATPTPEPTPIPGSS